MRRFLILAVLLLLPVTARAQAEVPKPPTVHQGSAVIFVHYYPPIFKQPRAALVTSEPFVCPPQHPHAGGECVNLVWFVKEPSDLCPPNGGGVQCILEFKFFVARDSTGKTEHTWHVYGEAEGEEDGSPPLP